MAAKFGYIKSKLGTILGVTPFYPVGYIIEETSGVNPEKWYGGVWELYGKGRVTVCIDNSDTDSNSKTNFNKAVGSLMGSKYLHRHNHTQALGGGLTTVNPVAGIGVIGMANNQGVSDAGSGDSQNIQPSILIYRWRKIAY